MLDDLVGNVIEELKNTGLYDNTIFVFSSDNGGMASAQVGNYPYRGICFENVVMSTANIDFAQKSYQYCIIDLYKYM